MSTLSQILEHKLIAIIRGARPSDVVKIAEALYKGGIRILEITMNSADPVEVIKAVAGAFGDSITVGAGTVLDADSARQAVAAGAKFILSPVANEDIIKAAKDLGVISIPGAFTATEIFNAFKNGADIVKIFPATSPSYIKDILGPLPQIKLLPTGGINIENIKEYQKAGAVGFGIGSALVDTKKEINEECLSELTIKAQKFIDAISK